MIWDRQPKWTEKIYIKWDYIEIANSASKYDSSKKYDNSTMGLT